MSTSRVYVAIDVNNLWHSCREEFGRFVRVNYRLLKDLIFDQYSGYLVASIRAYAIQLPGTKPQLLAANEKFLSLLKTLNFDVKTRRMRMEKGLLKPYATDWDVGITIDALENIKDYDTFVLISGDGDFALLLKHLKQKGKRVEVITFKKSHSSLLYEDADLITFITDDIVFKESYYGPRDQENPTPDQTDGD